MEFPELKNICSGVDGAPNGNHSLMPALRLADSMAWRIAKIVTTDMQNAGSPVA